MRRLLLLTLLAPALALAEDPVPAAAEAPAFPRFGVSAALGVPDGAVVSGVFRPVDFLRLSGGLSWNYFGYGVQAGAGVAPFHLPIDPTLNVEIGHYFNSDMSWVADRGAGVPAEVRPLMEDIGYSYVNAQLGIELGSSRRFVLFVRGGISYFWTNINGSAQSTNTSGTTTATVRVTDPEFRATMPSVKLGILFYL